MQVGGGEGKGRREKFSSWYWQRSPEKKKGGEGVSRLLTVSMGLVAVVPRL